MRIEQEKKYLQTRFKLIVSFFLCSGVPCICSHSLHCSKILIRRSIAFLEKTNFLSGTKGIVTQKGESLQAGKKIQSLPWLRVNGQWLKSRRHRYFRSNKNGICNNKGSGKAICGKALLSSQHACLLHRWSNVADS